MKKKRFIALLLAVMFLVACSGTDTEQEAFSETYITTTGINTAVTVEFETETAEDDTSLSVVEEVVPEEESAYDFPYEFYKKLSEITESYDHFLYYDISMAYYDLETGVSVMLNPDNHFFSASLMKAPYMLYIYRLALKGEADLEEKLLYTEEFKREGTGVLKNMQTDTEYTVEELIGYCLEESDNSAFAMLRKKFPEDGYTEYMKALGVIHDDDSKAVNHPQICCETALILSRAIYNFIEENNPYSENLRHHMTNSRNAMIYGTEGAEVVRKYGWYGGYFHDMAIIYDEKPYFITIMTNLDLLQIDVQEYGLFRDLSKLIAQYSGTLYETGKDGDKIIIQIPKMEENEMVLPKDPYMLLSVINMKLRDRYKSFEELCDDMNEDSEEITDAMGKLGYEYNEELNQFVIITEEKDKKPQE